MCKDLVADEQGRNEWPRGVETLPDSLVTEPICSMCDALRYVVYIPQISSINRYLCKVPVGVVKTMFWETSMFV